MSKSKVINVTSSSMPPFEEYVDEIKELWQSRWLTNSGIKHQDLEKKLKSYFSCENIKFFSNGHLALEAILNTMQLKGEIITTPFTYASTTQAIVRTGSIPVFCDVEPEYYTMDVGKIEALITEKTVAILPVHVYGNICNYKEIEKLASKYNLKVIYDAAHAFGVTTNDMSVANVGDASMFSFHATKVFHTIEGGCITFKDEELSNKLDAWKMFGMQGKEDAEYIGTNAKMTEFQAAMGLCNLRHVEDEINKRKKIVQRYRSNLSSINGITLCKEQNAVKSNYSYLPVVFEKNLFGKDRNEVIELLGKHNIFARKYFYPLTSQFSVYQDLFMIQKTPIAEEISKKILTLPLYADLELDDVDRICELILKG